MEASDTPRFTTRGFELKRWQQDAVERWLRGGHAGGGTGIFEIVTGGGKTLIALKCAEEAAKQCDDFRLVIVIPSVALAEQWRKTVREHTNVAKIGLLGGGSKDTLTDFTVLIAIINTAAKELISPPSPSQTMLVVDECHRAGAPHFKRVLDFPARFRLGLSATPEREEVDEFGEPLAFDDQILAKRLGPVVYSFSLSDARRIGWLPDYEVHHHALALHDDEMQEYDKRSRRIDELADRLRTFGVEPARARALQRKTNDLGAIARAYLSATTSRKDLLYKAKERNRVALELVARNLEDPRNRIILFNERIGGSSTLYRLISSTFGPNIAALEHSKLSSETRQRALQDFRDGRVRVLVSAKSLIEGIDVPDANIGISVASTASVRQRIQALGRVLRRPFATYNGDKFALMHLLYVADTVDESIYEKEDWADLIGHAQNRYFAWALSAAGPPVEQSGPPRRPVPTEEQEFARITMDGFSFPTLWHGSTRGHEYSVDTRGNVTNAYNAIITNPQNVDAMVYEVRHSRGGRFIVTPEYRFVLVSSRRANRTVWYAAGRLSEPFVSEERARELSINKSDDDYYSGPTDSTNGIYKIRSRAGGQIERRRNEEVIEFALIDSESSDPRELNGARVLDAWRQKIGSGIQFSVNQKWDAWYRQGGRPYFLAHVPGGFRWPEFD